MRNTSIMKQVAYLKWFLRWCTKKGYCMNNAYEEFQPQIAKHTEKGDIPHLGRTEQTQKLSDTRHKAIS